MKNNKVVLVDTEDKEIGVSDSGDAHLCPGLLHRAISILLYRVSDAGIELLVCQRSQKKNRWPGFWSNPVCTHPKPGEEYIETCVRRLKEELGIRMKKKSLQFLFRFAYEASYDGVLCEHELDSVFIAQRQGKLFPNSDEISSYTWLTIPQLQKEMVEKPTQYTPWFGKIVNRSELTDYLTLQASTV